MHRQRLCEETQKEDSHHNQGEGPGADPLLMPLEGTNPAETLILDFQLQNHETIHFYSLSHPVGGILLQQL